MNLAKMSVLLDDSADVRDGAIGGAAAHTADKAPVAAKGAKGFEKTW